MNTNKEVGFSSASIIDKAYAAPQLTCFGSVRDVTSSTGGAFNPDCKGGNSNESATCAEGGTGQRARS